MNILIFGPHPDDQEIGMGGTIGLLASQGHNVLLVDMTDGCPTPVGDRPTRLTEAVAAIAELSSRGGGGAGEGRIRRVLLDLPNRSVEHTLAARHLVAGVIRAHQAQVLFCPHPEDAHPDHVATTRIVEDARFDAKLTKVDMPPAPRQPAEYAPFGPPAPVGAPIYPKWLLYYYCSHLRRMPDPSFVIDTSLWLEAKKASLLAYRSQFVDNEKNRGVVEWLDAQDKFIGSRIGAKAGEGFWSKEPLGLTSLAGLLV